MDEAHWFTGWKARKADFQQRCSDEKRRLLTQLESPHDTQDAVLKDLVHISENSLSWKGVSMQHGNLASAFRSALPMRRYVDYERLIELESHAKGGVLSCSPVLRWLKTSGTTGVAKKVPYTLHWLTRYRVPAMYAMWATYLDAVPGMLASPYGVLDTQTVREKESNYVNGLPHQAVSNRQPPLTESDWTPPWYDAPWFDIGMPNVHEAKMYHRLRRLAGKDVRFISAINPSTLISLRDSAVQYADKLVREVADGTLDGVRIEDPNAGAAGELEKALGRNNFSMKAFWPSLTGISCWMSASARLYLDQLDDAYPGTTRIPFMTCGTEGVVTLPIDADTDSQPLAISQAFYEFVPADVDLDGILTRGETQPDTLLFDELKEGEEYHLVMSQGNGLYRLVTGDIFRVAAMSGRVPRLQFVRRDGVFHSFTGEKLTEGQVTEAVVTATREMGIRMGLYMCGPKWQHLPNYVLVLEVPALTHVDRDALADTIDRALRNINLEYASKRESNRLGRMQVVPIPHGAINAYIDAKRAAGNANQFKYKPFHKDIDFIEALNVSCSH
jgi:hypothetical protein